MMKKYIMGLVLVLFHTIAFGQYADGTLDGLVRFTCSTSTFTGGTSPFSGTIGTSGPSTDYNVDDLVIGDVILDPNGNLYEINTVTVTVASVTATVTVTFLAGTDATEVAPTSGIGMAARRSSGIGLLPSVANGSSSITESMEAAIITHNLNVIENQLGTSIGNITTGTLNAATASRTVDFGNNVVTFNNITVWRVNATSYVYGDGIGGNLPGLDSDSGDQILSLSTADGVGGRMEISSLRNISGAADPVNGTTIAFYNEQLYVNTTDGYLWRATTKAIDPDTDGTGSVFNRIAYSNLFTESLTLGSGIGHDLNGNDWSVSETGGPLIDLEPTNTRARFGYAGANAAIIVVDNTGIDLDFAGTGELNIDGAPGGSGQVLTSNGAGAAPTWETPSGGGASAIFSVNQVAHGLSAGQTVYVDNSGDWQLADLTNLAHGIVASVDDVDNFDVYAEVINIPSHGYTVGTVYYGSGTAGTPSTTASSTSQPLFIPVTSDYISWLGERAFTTGDPQTPTTITSTTAGTIDDFFIIIDASSSAVDYTLPALTTSDTNTVVRVMFDDVTNAANILTAANDTVQLSGGLIDFDIAGTAQGQFYLFRAISDSRWIIESSNRDYMLGWETYITSSPTRASPTSIAAGDSLTFDFTGASAITTYKPLGVDSLFNRTTTEIIAQLGAMVQLRIDVSVRSGTNDNFCVLKLDIDGAQDIIIERLISLPRGANIWHPVSISFNVYELATFVANGGEIRLVAEDSAIDIAMPSITVGKITSP